LAPIQVAKEAKPIWGTGIYNFSDLMFFFLGVTPIKVRRSKREADSPLVRLSFRDLMFYCYLDQDEIDSSFFFMEDPFRKLKSRDVMRFTVGYYSERLNDLEIEVERLAEARAGKLEGATQLKASLKELGYESGDEIRSAVEKLRSELRSAENERVSIRSGNLKDEHLVDELRNKLRGLSKNLAEEESALIDQSSSLDELERLRSELISAKLKFGRAEAASSVLAKAEFVRCPLCGVPIAEMEQRAVDACALCATPTERRMEIFSAESEAVQKDLDSRLDDLETAITRHREARKKQERRLDSLRIEKADLDRRLTVESQDYDSNYLARMRDVERRIATGEEKIHGMERLLRLPELVRSLEQAADQLAAEVTALRRDIEEEKGRLGEATKYVEEIESEFLKALLAVRIPGVDVDDEVQLDVRTWIPYVLPKGDETLRWGFDNAGSGGKKTLFKVCFAVAVHIVAEARKLPLPQFIIIDTPMKNIGEEVNKDLFRSFYTYLYKLASGSLANTQLIVIDKEFFPDSEHETSSFERYMTPDDPEFPPLVSYYRGP
jgi:hypothetical protein